MSTFKVVRRVAYTAYRDQVVLETDDWLEAEAYVLGKARSSPITMSQEPPQIRGTHPSHDFRPAYPGQVTTCLNAGCRSYDNGSYGSHAPCGTVFTTSLAQMVANHASTPPPPGVAAGAGGGES